ncbi:SUMF1/EgtB/PvdO family nonheme iron enzyme [Planctomyces sp. SH-PL62]|uniref:SUMF1/EgtB/PvdO family nonheme iron enzyme n=1 Tax=Planctomyces sp. SH-PL62 TaxID=1636152 RepID=UPI00078D4246|nr:SUMF1/EgtB/PvdO family nonheme iron enzyme [Planctomyces sp. SH-PL62]AMV38601.1 Serine/threonine-protein kinase pkn1 [Planctomyces sp. SH-PL62]
MNGDAPDEYDLADVPEPDRLDSEPPPPPKPTAPRVPGQPLPRMWKSEPDDAPVRPAASPKPRAAEPPPPPSRRGAPAAEGGSTRKTGLKPKPDLNEKGEKKVLIEDTPVFDTYETRQRVRLATGGMLVFVVGLAVYIVYSLFLYDPFPMDDLPPDDGYVVEAAPPPTKPDLDFEARAMLSRARESARNGRTDEAIALLEQLKKAYPKTRTAAQAQEALERPSQNLPLFLDGPTVKADAPAPQPPAAPEPPPAVVDARPPNAQVGGDARLAPPVNPAETLVVPPAPGEVAVQPASPGEAPDRRLPPGFAARPEAGVDPSGWPLAIVGDRDGAIMVFVPGGVFLMGEERDPQFASPEHKVRLGAYYIDRHEVTVGQFRRFVSETRYRGNWPAIDEKDEAKARAAEAMPMVLVSQADAMAFAEWAGKALPTEAQWEAAARTTDGRLYPWGDEPPNYSRKRVPRQVDAVMSFPEDRSPYDVFDLAGNVLEWTADAFDRNYYRSLAGRVVDDPAGAAPPRTGRYDVVVKGGKLGAASSREPIAPDKRLTYVGFRCALQVERLAPAPEIAVPVPASAPPSSPSRPASNPASPATKSAAPVVPF